MPWDCLFGLWVLSLPVSIANIFLFGETLVHMGWGWGYTQSTVLLKRENKGEKPPLHLSRRKWGRGAGLAVLVQGTEHFKALYTHYVTVSLKFYGADIGFHKDPHVQP